MTVITYQLSALHRIAQSGFHAFFSLHLAPQCELEHFCEIAFFLESSITGNSCISTAVKEISTLINWNHRILPALLSSDL